MDGCSLNDAFPSGGVGSVDCLETKAGDISRRQEKKKARRCRGPALTYLNGGWNNVGPVDPDTPTAPIAAVPQLNPKTDLRQHAPVTQQYDFETFVGGMDDLPAIRRDVEGPNALQPSASPSFFGASPDETPSNVGVAPKKGLVETFTSASAPFMNVIGEDETYRLTPDFGSAFGSKGAQKASAQPLGSGPSPTSKETAYLTPTSMMPSGTLPFPNIDNFWKDRALAGGQSSFFAHLKPPSGTPTGPVTEPEAAADVPASRREVLTKLDQIFARLDDMEQSKGENAQTEVLLFILTGLGVIFLMDIGCRAAAVAGRR